MAEPYTPQMSLAYDARALHAGEVRLQSLAMCYITYCFSATTMVTRTRLSVTLYRPTLLVLLIDILVLYTQVVIYSLSSFILAMY
jgi:hypothetical protein